MYVFCCHGWKNPDHFFESKEHGGKNYKVIEDGYIEGHGFVALKALKNYLLENKWTEVSPPGELGDVVIWERAEDGKAGEAVGSTSHVGIYVGPNRVVSNSSSKAMPVEHPAGEEPDSSYWNTTMKARAILRPPKRATYVPMEP